ncbi:MAG: hypothetical protein MHPSP_003181, partial [Paramarteilia canceri]
MSFVDRVNLHLRLFNAPELFSYGLQMYQPNGAETLGTNLNSWVQWFKGKSAIILPIYVLYQIMHNGEAFRIAKNCFKICGITAGLYALSMFLI